MARAGDDLHFERSDQAIGVSIVVAFADTADKGFDPGFGWTLSIADAY
jgi:hypothetical protein